MMRKRIHLAFAAQAVILTITTAHGDLVVSEGFDYTAGTEIRGQGTGVGWDGNWTGTDTDTRGTPEAGAGLGFDPLEVSGGSYIRPQRYGVAESSREISSASQAALTADGTTIWFSVLMEPNTGGNGGGYAANSHGAIVFGDTAFVSTTNPGTTPPAIGSGGNALGVSFDGDGSDPDDIGIHGVSYDNGTRTAHTADLVVIGDNMVMIVGRIDWAANGSNDVMSLYIITDPSATLPAAFSTISVDLDQSGFDLVAIGQGQTEIFDEIRFGESYADVAPVDTTTPTPNPMTFAMAPVGISATEVTMTATTATSSDSVEYLFTNTTLATDSGWQDSPSWTDTGLAPDTTYSYTVTARNKSAPQYETSPSAAASATTYLTLSQNDILATGFDGRSVSGKTADNIPWATNGVADPGALTWVPDDPQSSSGAGATLFDTVDTAGHFAPQRNIDTEGAWSVSIPLVLTVPQIELGDVSLSWTHFNNSGNDQTAARSADWTATVTGSLSGVIDSVTTTGVSGLAGVTLLSFSSPLTLTDSETYTLKIHVVGTDFPGTGNNTGLDRILVGNIPPDTRPNILFLMADDQRYDTLGCYGHPVVQTPVIDTLASQGIRFTNSFVTTAICAASRASILTGVTERTHGYTFGMPSVPSQLDAVTYPRLLGEAGYHTGFIGKYGVSLAAPASSHFDSVQHVAGYATSTPYFIEQPDGSYRHSTNVCADKAIEFIEGRNPGQPFCLSVSFNAPHARDGATVAEESYPWPPSSDGLYLTEDMPDQGLNETWFDSQPEFVRTSINRNRFNWRWDTPEKYDAHLRAHLRMITGIDTAIGNILAVLASEGLADNTIIVYTADNGLFLGARGFAGKWNHYEQALRVPLVVYDPRLPEAKRGRVESAIALNIDFAPTFLDWAGETAHQRYQGVSLAPLIEDSSELTRRDFFCEHHMDNSSIPKWQGVRDQRYVYANYYEEGYEYLHDIQADPDQWINLALDPAYQDVLDQMQERSATYQAILQPRDSVAASETLVIDSDSDGLLDHWEMEHFGTLLGEGLDDSDGDGSSDLSEAVAGTDPNDPQSRPTLRIDPDLGLEYTPYVPGRVFDLQHTEDLATQPWSDLPLPGTWNGSRVEFDASGITGDKAFFRMRITDPTAP